MRGRLAKQIATLIIPVTATCLVSPAALAAPAAQGGLIDRDFEVAIRKFATRRFCNKIDATDDQREKITTIVSTTMDKTRPAREHLRQGVLDLSSLLAAGETTDEQIKAKVDELQQLRQNLADSRVQSLLEVRKLLTADQRQQLNARVQELLTGKSILKPRKLSMLMDLAE